MKQPDILYHYTTSFGLSGILNSKSIWLSDPRYLNDGLEIKYGVQLFESVLHDAATSFDKSAEPYIAKIKKELYTTEQTHYVASFCETDDLLSQWRGYANSGVGYSIGFKSESLAKNSESVLKKVIYDKEEQVKAILSYINKCIPASTTDYAAFDVSTDLFSLLLSLKHSSFSEEREWRLIDSFIGWKPGIQSLDIKFRPSKNYFIPYREIQPQLIEARGEMVLPIKSIRVGPSPEPSLAKEALNWLLWEKRYIVGKGNLETFNSISPYRT